MVWNNKTVFITGGGGFLGRYIIEQLISLNCKKIISYGRSQQPELVEMGVEVICGDISNSELLSNNSKGVDILFHTAAKAGIWGKYKEFYNTNVEGTKSVIVACQKNKIPILINTSSPSVVSTDHDIKGENENLPYPDNYLAYYPETKAEAEQIVANSANSHLRTISLRPHLIWGPRDPHILPRIFAKAAQKRLIQIGDGENIVDLTYVENAAFAHIKAAESLIDSDRASGNKYFISDDNPLSLWEWINDRLKDMEFSTIKKNISYRKAKNIGAIFEFIFKLLNISSEPPVTRFVAAQMAFSHYFDISAAKNDLKYSPMIDNSEAIKKTINYFKGEEG